jgi:hypothetical protein
MCTPSMTAIPMQEQCCVEAVCRVAGVVKNVGDARVDMIAKAGAGSRCWVIEELEPTGSIQPSEPS